MKSQLLFLVSLFSLCININAQELSCKTGNVYTFNENTIQYTYDKSTITIDANRFIHIQSDRYEPDIYKIINYSVESGCTVYSIETTTFDKGRLKICDGSEYLAELIIYIEQENNSAFRKKITWINCKKN